MNVCIVGDSKLGKTYSLSTLNGVTVVLNLDPGGYQAIRKNYLLVPPGQLQQALDDLTAEDTILVVDYCQLAMPAISPGASRDGRKGSGEQAYRALIADTNAALSSNRVANVCLDGLTGLGEVTLNAILSMNKRSRPVFEDWGQAIDKITEIVSVCAASQNNFILLCHLQTEKDEITGRIKETPLIYGKQLPNKLMALFDNVFAAGYSGNTYYWVTKPQPLMPTIGSRIFDDLPERVLPNLGDLLAHKFTAVVTQRQGQ